MNKLNSIVLLAGGALVAVAATGCSSSAKAAATGPVANAPTTAATSAANAPSTTGASAPNTAAGGTSALSGRSTTAPAANTPPTTKADGGATTAANPPAGHPLCDNAKLNASLAQGQGQSPAMPIIAVKNTGPTCLISPIPYLWITASATDVSHELRPLVPGGTPGTAKLQTFLAGTTLYAAVDLNPNSVADAPGSYTNLAVTANPTRDSSGKDVQDLQLPMAANVSGPKLGVYTTNQSTAIDALQYSTTLEN